MPQQYTPDTFPKMLPHPEGERIDPPTPDEPPPFVKEAAITRRLALAALRLAVFAIGTRTLSSRIFGSREFATLATWSGASVGDEATRATNAAIFEAVAALREAGEVSE